MTTDSQKFDAICRAYSYGNLSYAELTEELEALKKAREACEAAS